jgi:hypothetical protein
MPDGFETKVSRKIKPQIKHSFDTFILGKMENKPKYKKISFFLTCFSSDEDQTNATFDVRAFRHCNRIIDFLT